jgi:hypothetical protein
MRQRTGNSFRRVGHRHEQSERTARKWRESKVAIEGRCRFIRRFDHDGEYRERTGGINYPTNCVGEQKIANTFAANFLIARETPNESRWNDVIAWQTFCIYGRQVGDGECEGTQAVETDDPTFIVDGDKTRATLRFSSCPARRWNQSSSAAIPHENAARSCLPSGTIALIIHNQPKRWR